MNKGWIVEGHFRVTGQNPTTGESRTFVDRRNMIMYPATEIVALGLGGRSNTKISHLYLAYNNDGTLGNGGYTLTPDNTEFEKSSVTNFVRVPITFEPSIEYAEDGSWTSLTFNTLINQPDVFAIPGYASLSGGTSAFFEASLVCQTSSLGSPSLLDFDRVFSRVAFDRLTYDPLFNLTITWSIRLNHQS